MSYDTLSAIRTMSLNPLAREECRHGLYKRYEALIGRMKTAAAGEQL